MAPRLKFDSLDKRLLAARDPDFVIDASNEAAEVSGPMTIRIVRTADDRLQLTIDFSGVEFPIVLSRTQTLRQLHIAGES